MEEAFGMGTPPIISVEEMRRRCVEEPPNPVTLPGQPIPRVYDPRLPERMPHGPTQTSQPSAITIDNGIIGSPEKYVRRTLSRR